MSDPTADAYRLAADYLYPLGVTGAQHLRKEADRLDAAHVTAADIGDELMAKAAQGCGPLNLGLLALELVGQHYELQPLPQVAAADPS